jgi:hypothetical protein
MQELIDSQHVQLQQVARDTRQVCSAEKRSLEDLLKSKDAELKQEQKKTKDASTEAKAAKAESKKLQHRITALAGEVDGMGMYKEEVDCLEAEQEVMKAQTKRQSQLGTGHEIIIYCSCSR